MTKEYLEDFDYKYKNYDYEIKKINREIIAENNKTTVDSVSGSRKSFPFVQSHIKVEGRNETRIRKLEKRKKLFEHKKEKLIKELKYKISKLDDRILADIIEMYHLKSMSFSQIAIQMKYSNESGARNYYNRLLKK